MTGIIKQVETFLSTLNNDLGAFVCLFSQHQELNYLNLGSNFKFTKSKGEKDC